MSALVRLCLRFKTVTLLLVVLLLGAGALSVMGLIRNCSPR